MKNKIIALSSQAFRYALIGGLCTILDLFILFILTHYGYLSYLVSGTISFISGSTLNYFLSAGIVFTDRPITNKKIEFSAYLLVSVIGLVVNLSILYLLTSYFGLFYMVAKIIATGFTFIWNFLARRQLIHSTSFIGKIINRQNDND